MSNPDVKSLSAFTRMVQSALQKRGIVGVDESVLRDAHAEVFRDLDWSAFSASVAAELASEPQATRTDARCPASVDIWTPALSPLIELGRYKSITSVKVNAWFAQAPEEDILALYQAGFEGAGTFD
jgi:hypothetical protein